MGERPQSHGVGPPKCDPSGCGTPAEPADGEGASAGVAVQGSANQGSASGAATGRSRAEERSCTSGRRPRTSAPSQAASSGAQACPSEAGLAPLAARGRPLQAADMLKRPKVTCRHPVEPHPPMAKRRLHRVPRAHKGCSSATVWGPLGPDSESCDLYSRVAPYECLAGLSRNTREYNFLSGRCLRGPDVEFPGA